MTPLDIALVGHGYCLVPRVPFEIGRLAGGDAVIVHHVPPPQPKLRIATSAGRVQIALGPGTSTPEEVLADYYDGEPIEAPGWQIRCAAGYTIPWCDGVSIWSTTEDVTWPFELTLAGATGRDEMLYVQGPFVADPPRLEALVAASMRLVGRAQMPGRYGAIDAIEVAYSHQGLDWRQWRYLVRLGDGGTVLVTAQASASSYAAMLSLGQTVAQNLG